MGLKIKRDKFLNIKVTEGERDQWRQLAEAHGVSVADLIRSAVGGFRLTHRTPPVRRASVRRVDPELIRELARIGNNLNQVGRWVNMYKSEADAEQVLAGLTIIERELAEIRAEHAPNQPKSSQDEDEGDAH